MNWLKARKAKRIQKEIEYIANLLLATPNISYKSQLEIIEGAQDLYKQELESLTPTN